MDFTLTRKAIEAEKRYESGKVQTHLKAEAMVLGAGRENVDVLLSDCRVRITSVEAGNDRVIAEGEAVCQAAYKVGSEASARAANAVAPISCAFDMKGVLSGMNAKVFSEVDEVTAKYENGHMVFDVYLTMSAFVTSLVPVNVIVGCENMGELQTMYEDVKSVKLAAENVGTQVVSQTVNLPAALDARYALMEWATITQLDHQKEPGGVKVTGNVLVETLISTGLPEKPVQLVRYRMPIDRFMEMPEWLTDNVYLDADIVSVKTNVNQAVMGDDATLLMEAEVEIRVNATGEDRTQALTDAFSTGDSRIVCDKKTVDVCLAVSRITMSEPFRSSVLLQDSSGSVGEVCAVKTRAVLGDVISDGARTMVSGIVNAQVVYMTGDGEELKSENQDFPFEISVSCALDEKGRVRVLAVSPEGNALMSDRIEVKCMLALSADKRTDGKITIADGLAEAGENNKIKGVMIVWPNPNDTAWSIAKKYITTVDNVQNAFDDETSNQKPLVLRL